MIISKIKFISKEIQKQIPYPHKLIHDHYALIIRKDRALIFTHKPLSHPHPPSYYISHLDIENKPIPQYLSSYVYKIEPSITLMYPVENSENYIVTNFAQISKARVSIDLEHQVISLTDYLIT